MTGRAGRATLGPRLVWGLALVGLMPVVPLGLGLASRPAAPSVVEVASGASLLVALGAFILSGAVVASRQPSNPTGWLLLVPGLAMPVTTVATGWLATLDPPPTAADPVLWLALWITSWSWVLLIFPIFHLLLTFPTGRLLSARWRWAVLLEGAMIATMLGLGAFSQQLAVTTDDGAAIWSIANPVGFLPLDVWATLEPIWSASLILMALAAIAAFAVRFRRGSRTERQQLKWPLAAATLFAFWYSLAAVVPGWHESAIGNVVFGLSVAGLPVSVAVAVLRYRLYEIDRIISRTLGWAVVTGVLVAVFAGGVVGLSALLAGLAEGETLAAAVSTLVAFALFAPLRQRVQAAVDRRFDRARYDAQRTADTFAERLRDEVDLAALGTALIGTVDDAVRPAGAGLWLRSGGSGR